MIAVHWESVRVKKLENTEENRNCCADCASSVRVIWFEWPRISASQCRRTAHTSHSDFFVICNRSYFFVTSNVIFCEVKKTGVRAVRAVRRLYGRVFRHYRDAAVILDAHDAQNLYLC